MNYISLDNLTRYHSKFKDYADAKYTLANDYGWKQTEKAGAVACWPVGESRMKPVVEFLFKETLPEGTKGLENPSTISGVESVKVTRCGKNICSSGLLPGADVMRVRGINVSYDSTDGSWVLKGTANTNTTPYLYLFTDGNLNKYTDALVRGKTYTFSIKCSDSNVSSQVIDSVYADQWGGDGSFSAYCNANSSLTHAMLPDGKSFIFRLLVARGATVDTKVYVQVEEGSTASSFEPYAGADYAIDLNGTFYGGTLDVASGRLTVTHRMIEADSLTLDISNYPAYLPLECTDTFGRTITSNGNILALTGSTGGKIVYKLANPYTVQIDPVAITSLPQIDKYTPRLNTLYTDAENITVKYIKSPIRDEYEKVQAIIANGGTI